MSSILIRIISFVFIMETLTVGDASGWRLNDHDDAVRAKNSGSAVDLSEHLPKIEAQYRSRVINIEMIERGEVMIYKLYLMGDHGDLQHLFLDAKNGRIMMSLGVRLYPNIDID